MDKAKDETILDKALGLFWGKARNYLMTVIGKAAFDVWLNNSAIDHRLTELRVILPKARHLIERSECWQSPKYDSIEELHSQLKDCVYEAESIVDEFEYQRSKNEVEKSIPGADFFENWKNSFPIKVKEVNDRLNKEYNDLKKKCDDNCIPENPNQFSQTVRDYRRDRSTFLESSNVIGRDKELNKVIRLIIRVPSSGSNQRKRVKGKSMSNFETGESSNIMDKKQNVSVLPIVGMGGVGKTTLAQIVREDPRVKSHFDLIMWVCISDNFDLVRVTKDIIESATEKVCSLSNLDTLRKTLQGKLNSKRFLLVLDDVWSKDWQQLLALMEGASEGSVVLVTTRSLEYCVDPVTSSIKLEGLEDDIYWKLFKICTFGEVAQSDNFKIPEQLEPIGKKICDKLKGSPLAAKTIGGVLETNLDVEHWRKVKDSKIWELQTGENGIIPVLQLSYQYLPSHLKKCFSFCSLYPKDFQFTQPELTKFWIMQGLIEPLNNFQELITLADNYFLDLVRRCFFQTNTRHLDRFDEYTKYVIHDLMHDVCQSIKKGECFSLENGHPNQVSPHIRHVSDYRKKLHLKEQEELCRYNKLLSLKVHYADSCCITAIKSWSNTLTNIRSLSLARCKIEKLPENIGNLKHLLCLDISGTKVKTLPDSFCRLFNLHYLNMNDCNHIMSFPEGSKKLVNLLLLSLPLKKVSLVKHIENMFKAIHFFDLNVDLREENIENLKNISRIGGSVTIHGLATISSREAAEDAQLESKPVRILDLVWDEGSVIIESHDAEVLCGLCPHPNLKILRISLYKGTDFSPSWLKEKSWPNLTEVFFWCCKVSTISYLPMSLKHIRIQNCHELVSLPVESFGGFESLEWLIIDTCPKLKSRNAMILPPSVKCLELRSCDDLVENSIPSCLQNLTSLETLSISNCQKLVSIPVEVTNNLKSLSELYFIKCSKLQLQEGVDKFLESLQKVAIKNCVQFQETSGQDIFGKLPSGSPKDIPSSSKNRKRRTRRA